MLDTQLKMLCASLPPRTAFISFANYLDPGRTAKPNTRSPAFEGAIRPAGGRAGGRDRRYQRSWGRQEVWVDDGRHQSTAFDRTE